MDTKDLREKTQETAQELLEKGKDIVKDLKERAEESGLTEKVAEIRDNIVEKAKEFTSGAGKEIDKNPVLRNAKDKASEITEKAGETIKKTKEELLKRSEKPREEIYDRAEEIKKDAENKIKEVRGNMKRHDHRSEGNLGRTFAGVALATAAAAGAYTIYINKKNKEENVKAEFSEQLKKWNEMDHYTVQEENEGKKEKMVVRVSKVYPAGKNALLGEDIIINISPVGKEVTFNPEEISEPVNPLAEFKKKAGEIAGMVQEKITKLSEDVSSKAGEFRENTREAADRLMEGGKEGIENVKDKAEEISDDLKYKVENVRSDVKEDLENAGKNIEEGFEKTKEEIGASLPSFKERAGKLGEEIVAGAGKFGEGLKQGAGMIKEKAGEIAENLKERAEKAGQDIKKGGENLREKAEEVKDDLKFKAENAEKDMEEGLEKTREEVGADESFKIRKDLDEENPGCRLNDAIEKKKEEDILENKSESKDSGNEDNIERISMGKTSKIDDFSAISAAKATDEEKKTVTDGKEIGTEVTEKMVYNPGTEGNVTSKEYGTESMEVKTEGTVVSPEGKGTKVFKPGARNEEMEKFMNASPDRNIEWEDDKSIIMKKGEELKEAATSGFDALKKALEGVRKQIMSAVENGKKYAEEKSEEREETPEETLITEEFNITIHNKGNKDYFFSPMLIQRYNTKTRTTLPCPCHEEGTTVEKKIVKPGETYSGKICVKKSEEDDALIVFEDMMLNNSIAVLLKDELDEEYGNREKEDLVDNLLFDDENIAENDETMSLDKELKEEVKDGVEEEF